MTTNTVLTQIEASLKSVGKIANFTPQEKLRSNGKEVIVIITNISLEIETSKTYIIETEISIGWEEENGKEMVDTLKTMITTIENGFTSPPLNFKFGDPELDTDINGTAYIVRLPCSYKEIVTVT